MGRELRMVPPNWDHPKVERRSGEEHYQPMHDENFEDAAAEWKKLFLAWEAGDDPERFSESANNCEFWEWHGGPPDREYYRPWKDSEATWFQVWETVSEGTPVSPPFATKEELIEYLVANGDFWDQSRRAEGRCGFMNCDPWSRKQAEAFVNGPGWAPSMVMYSKGLRSGVQAMADQ
jgi:hypothetical protein